MKYIETPTGEVFKYEDCIIFDDNEDSVQDELAKELFSQTGILIANIERR